MVLNLNSPILLKPNSPQSVQLQCRENKKVSSKSSLPLNAACMPFETTSCQLLDHGEYVRSDPEPADSVILGAEQSGLYCNLNRKRVTGAGIRHPHNNT